MVPFSIFPILDVIGLIAFAISGAIVGVRKEMDVYGVFLLAIATAIGGGTIRDVLIGNIPPLVLIDPTPIVIAIGATVAIFFFGGMLQRDFRALLIMDAIGLGMFTVTGVSFGLQFDIPVYGAVLLGVITSTAGGILRDLLGGDIPLVLRKDIYASASLIGGLLYWFAYLYVPLDPDLSALLSTVFVIAIRLLSFKRNWHLPYPHKSSRSTGNHPSTLSGPSKKP